MLIVLIVRHDTELFEQVDSIPLAPSLDNAILFYPYDLDTLENDSLTRRLSSQERSPVSAGRGPSQGHLAG